MYQDTVDEQWVAQALAAFDPAKISYVDVGEPEVALVEQLTFAPWQPPLAKLGS